MKVCHAEVQQNGKDEALEAQLRLAAIVESSEDAIIGKTLDGTITSWNVAAERIYGYTAQEAIGKPISLVIPSDRHEEMTGILERLRRGERVARFETVRQRKDGALIHVELTVSPVMDLDGCVLGAATIARDVSDRKRAEDDLKKSRAELLKISRRAGMADMASSVLHNVGNVLNSVNISASVVSDHLKNSEVVNVTRVAALMREHAADLGEFITRDPRGSQLPSFLSQLAEQLTDEQATLLKEMGLVLKNVEHIKEILALQQSYARLSGVSEIVRVTDLVEDALLMNAGALARHAVRIVREYQPQAPEITVEKHKVLQILVNLISNAKYACDEMNDIERSITIRVSNSDSRVRIAVIDNGVGIPAENFPKIFTHGFTTRKNGHGFGLHGGSQIARELGGSLTAQSDGPGKGATFTLELPLRQPAAE